MWHEENCELASGCFSPKTSQERGFSFIELLMVVAVISILSALAVPHLQRIRMNSHEKVTIANLRTAYDAQLMHSNQFQTFGQLTELVSAEFLDGSLLDGQKSGYAYSFSNVTTSTFEIVAVPIEPGVSGTRGFFIDETGVIRYDESGGAPGRSSAAWSSNQ